MVDPIISTGLAKDWLERLLKSWSTLRKTREDELDGEALYDPEDLPERHDPERVRQAMAILSP